MERREPLSGKYEKRRWQLFRIYMIAKNRWSVGKYVLQTICFVLFPAFAYCPSSVILYCAQAYTNGLADCSRTAGIVF